MYNRGQKPSKKITSPPRCDAKNFSLLLRLRSGKKKLFKVTIMTLGRVGLAGKIATASNFFSLLLLHPLGCEANVWKRMRPKLQREQKNSSIFFVCSKSFAWAEVYGFVRASREKHGKKIQFVHTHPRKCVVLSKVTKSYLSRFDRSRKKQFQIFYPLYSLAHTFFSLFSPYIIAKMRSFASAIHAIFNHQSLFVSARQKSCDSSVKRSETGRKKVVWSYFIAGAVRSVGCVWYDMCDDSQHGDTPTMCVCMWGGGNYAPIWQPLKTVSFRDVFFRLSSKMSLEIWSTANGQ